LADYWSLITDYQLPQQKRPAIPGRPHSQNRLKHEPHDGAASLCAAVADVFTKSFNSLLGLKKGIFFAGTSTFSPVFGFRPIRPRRWRVRKLPNPRISILSPARSDRTTLSKIASTITSLSLRVSSASRETSSIRSAFVIMSLHSGTGRSLTH